MPKSYLNQPGLPLGLRNNNPGNLRTGSAWKGMIGSNAGFVVFSNLGYGLRALAIDLDTKIERGLNTIQKIISVYAPPVENNTAQYISLVVQQTGINQNAILSADATTIAKLMRAIVNVEIGMQYSSYVTNQDIAEGIQMAADRITPGDVAIVGTGVGTLLLAGYLLYQFWWKDYQRKL